MPQDFERRCKMKIAIDRIVVSKDNPRQTFDEEGLRRLGESIKSHGQLQAIVVRPRGSGYELVVGERRLRASVLVGLETIEAEVRDVDDGTAMELRLIENTQREDLSDAEKGDAVLALWANYDKYETIKDVAKAIDIPYSTVNKWAWQSSKLSPKVRRKIELESLSEDHGYYLAKYPISIQEKLADLIVKRKIPNDVFRNLIKLYDANPQRDLDAIADEVLGIETVTVPTSMLSPELQKTIEEQRQLAKVQRIRKKPSKPITKEQVKERIGKNSAYKFEKVKVSQGTKGLESPLKSTIKPLAVPNPNNPDYSLCQCALCPLFAKHCKGRCWA